MVGAVVEQVPSVKNTRNMSLEMLFLPVGLNSPKMRLVVGLRLDPLGELAALPGHCN